MEQNRIDNLCHMWSSGGPREGCCRFCNWMITVYKYYIYIYNIYIYQIERQREIHVHISTYVQGYSTPQILYICMSVILFSTFSYFNPKLELYLVYVIPYPCLLNNLQAESICCANIVIQFPEIAPEIRVTEMPHNPQL